MNSEMKKILILIFLFTRFVTYGQQSIMDSINNQASEYGCGTSHFIIEYRSGSYTSREVSIITEDSANSGTVRIHVFFQDTALTSLDTNFVLSANQVSILQSFYQTAGSNSNPDPSLQIIQQGTAVLKVDVGCAGNPCLNYSSNAHISLYRTLISDWNNWYK